MGLERYKQYYNGGYYHIYNRGVGKQNIFLDEQDYGQYIKRLRKYKESHQVSLVCYCLMPNHLHLQVRQNKSEPIYKFIQSLHTSYSMYFNKKYKRVGPLWQDRFKQKNIDDDSLLFYISFYIHLNPLLDGIVNKLENYKWSSYLDYAGLRNGTLCEKGIILKGMSLAGYVQMMNKYKNGIQDRKEMRYLFKEKVIQEQSSRQLENCP